MINMYTCMITVMNNDHTFDSRGYVGTIKGLDDYLYEKLGNITSTAVENSFIKPTDLHIAYIGERGCAYVIAKTM